MKKLRVHFYTVEQFGKAEPIEDVLRKIQALDLADRTRTCHFAKIRVDDIVPPEQDRSYWILRFSRFRDDNWPGVATVEEASKDLELDEDALLSEETFVIYDPAKNRMVVQYNHFGVRASKVQEYLTQCTRYAEGGYELLPVLTEDALDRFNSKKIITSVEAVIDNVSPQDIAYFGGSGLADCIKQGSDAGATRVRFTLSVDGRERKNRLDSGVVRPIIDRLLGRSGENDKVIVGAKEVEEDAVELLNLLESRKYVEYNAESIPRTLGRRYSPEFMIQLLDQALREWDKSQ
ncbi:DUF6731 family protein [Burkholderia gladioli]|uniref:DUF6731 family protein n=1 Tax=Burkholderia gladioli TaxID=28095 RepID=UPI000D00ADBA|nr:DUF6731 family protein [Burkholderia gladioli]PRH29675.1 hypothetical protein C6V07_31250 [Burkholderia gladioli]